MALRKGGLKPVERRADGDAAPACFVCGRQREQGIALMHAFLCESCEGHIIVADVSDGDYDFLVQRVTACWRTLSGEAAGAKA